MKAPLLVASGTSSILAVLALLAMTPAPARAEGEDTGAYVKRTLRCDGFEDNRCFRFADPRRRGKPFLQPHLHRQPVPDPCADAQEHPVEGLRLFRRSENIVAGLAELRLNDVV